MATPLCRFLARHPRPLLFEDRQYEGYCTCSNLYLTDRCSYGIADGEKDTIVDVGPLHYLYAGMMRLEQREKVAPGKRFFVVWLGEGKEPPETPRPVTRLKSISPKIKHKASTTPQLQPARSERLGNILETGQKYELGCVVAPNDKQRAELGELCRYVSDDGVRHACSQKSNNLFFFHREHESGEYNCLFAAELSSAQISSTFVMQIQILGIKHSYRLMKLVLSGIWISEIPDCSRLRTINFRTASTDREIPWKTLGFTSIHKTKKDRNLMKDFIPSKLP